MESRRDFLKKGAYAAPVVLTLGGIRASFASGTYGGGGGNGPPGGPFGNNGVGNGEDPQPPGNPPINDGPGTGPGNPGNQGGPN